MKKMLNSQSGFTLVELMVVVAIIGVLSAIAVPNFKKYQAKSKTSEAKLQLSAAYTALQSFYADYDSYAPCLLYMGYNPNNEYAQRNYAIGLGSGSNVAGVSGVVLLQNGVDTTTACPVSLQAACSTTSATSCTLFSAGKSLGGTAGLGTFAAADAGTTVVAEASFTIGAVGFIDRNFVTAATASAFNINENKKIVQVRAGY